VIALLSFKNVYKRLYGAYRGVKMTNSQETFDNLVKQLRKAPRSKSGRSKKYSIELRNDVVAYLAEFPEAINDMAKQAGVAKASIKYWIDAVKPAEEEVRRIMVNAGLIEDVTASNVLRTQIEDMQRTLEMIVELEQRGYVVLKK